MQHDRLNLVTGAMGFCGMHLVQALLAAGERVVATDTPTTLASAERRAVLDLVGVGRSHPALRWIAADLLAPETLDALFDAPITHIYHTASLYDYSAPLSRLMRVNVDGTRNLLERALAARCLARFVHFSTCGVFGKPRSRAQSPTVNIPFSEDNSSPKTAPLRATGPDGTRLVNVYSVSKWQQEQLLWRAWREQGLPLTVLRPAPVYGPGSTYGHGGVILLVAHGLVPAFPADGARYINATVHVEDVARFALHITSSDAGIGEDYNVSDDSTISFCEFLDHIALLMGRRIRRIPLLPMTALRPLFVGAAHALALLERQLSLPRLRIFEVQSTTYVASSYWVSNRKSKASGFDYRYPQVQLGLEDTVAWLRRVGWLNDRSLLFAARAS